LRNSSAPSIQRSRPQTAGQRRMIPEPAKLMLLHAAESTFGPITSVAELVVGTLNRLGAMLWRGLEHRGALQHLRQKEMLPPRARDCQTAQEFPH
jgi:hypothetical protein